MAEPEQGSGGINPKKIVIWSADAKAELRIVDRETAIRILNAIDYFLSTGSGDVIKLQPPRFEFRLRVGDYRVIFLRVDISTIEVLHVRHRSEAYR
jgi:mRNA-degrading endonuclease RelE of RelBE toxin-antitoxin system